MRDLFNYNLPKIEFKRDKPIKIFEAFAGIGCQRMALNRIVGEDNVISLGISEIDEFALRSYKAIHGDLHNYGDITKIKGEDLPKEIDIFTWSFPCQDLSISGKQEGLKNTRSGLGFEVIRILKEMNKEYRPKVLLMENVPPLITNTKFRDGWETMKKEIEDLGYTNYIYILNSKDYGVAQRRKRVFMVSLLGNKFYQFPKPIELNKSIKDYLEKDVDEWFYLSQKSGERDLKQKLADHYIDKGLIEEYNIINHSFSMNRKNSEKVDATNGIMITLTTRPDTLGVAESHTGRLRIRKLTPRETWRFMGIEDEYFDRASKVNSNAQLYKQAGNGIVVDVLEHIFNNMFEE